MECTDEEMNSQTGRKIQGGNEPEVLEVERS